MNQNKSICRNDPKDESGSTFVTNHSITIFGLSFIILLYEINTGAVSGISGNSESSKLAEKDKSEIYNQTKKEEHFCDRKVKLAEYEKLPIVFLNSFPGSGNT